MNESALLRATVAFAELSTVLTPFLDAKMPGAHSAGSSWFDAVEPEIRSPSRLSPRDPYFQLQVVRKFASKLFPSEADGAREDALTLFRYRNRWAHYEELSATDVDDLCQRVIRLCRRAGHDAEARLNGPPTVERELEFPDPSDLGGRRRRRAEERIARLRADDEARARRLAAAAAGLGDGGAVLERRDADRLISRLTSPSDTAWAREARGLLVMVEGRLTIDRLLLPVVLASHGCRQPFADDPAVPATKTSIALAFLQGRSDAHRTLDVAFGYLTSLVGRIAKSRPPQSINWALQQCRLAGDRAATSLLPWFGDTTGTVAQFCEDLGEYLPAGFTRDEPVLDELIGSVLDAIELDPFVCAEAFLWWSTKLHQYLALLGPSDVRGGTPPTFTREAAKAAGELIRLYRTRAVDPVTGWPPFPAIALVTTTHTAAFFQGLGMSIRPIEGTADADADEGGAAAPVHESEGLPKDFDLVVNVVQRRRAAVQDDGVTDDTIDVWTLAASIWMRLGTGEFNEAVLVDGRLGECALALAEAGPPAAAGFARAACELLWAFCFDLREDDVTSARKLGSVVAAGATIETRAEADRFGGEVVEALRLSAADGPDEDIDVLITSIGRQMAQDPGRVRRLIVPWIGAVTAVFDFCRERMTADDVTDRATEAITYFENNWALQPGHPPAHVFRRVERDGRDS